MKGTELVLKALRDNGVQYVFGYTGGAIMPVFDEMEKQRVFSFIMSRHEQGAAFMANVWGRLTGQAGVCLATLGPGATNLITGAADANLDKVPVVAITAQGSLTRLHHESHQYLDIVNMFRPITKWNTAIADPGVNNELVQKLSRHWSRFK